ncbi:MAG: NADH-quinone oxidoreductase subunit L [Nitrospirae bacterium]|nr:NADH-quinone oxidoreductase subunit L [Nitrospirota bacterium]
MPRIWLIPLVPLAGFVVLGLFHRWIPKKAISWIACGTVAVSFVLSFKSFLPLMRGGDPIHSVFFTWLTIGDFSVVFDYLFDPLSSVMALVISGVGFLIHVFSVGYMGHDKGFGRYFAYLNLFIFFMLTLVLSNSLLLTFVGWEGVGLCSYLLIGFWYDKPDPPPAAVKAFVVNRIGDFGFITAMVLLLAHLHTLSISEILNMAPEYYAGLPAVAGLIGLLLFLAATGKSAQVPLYVWLPDAMAGPTPVSALIHAATMVTAGVYLMARFRPVLDIVPDVTALICTIGAVTALLAALIALAQRDIKKVLAYSTVSQLGYMFMGVSAGSGVAGMFHLTTHAFFKALLFLGAGSVIHAMEGEQDITKMGGLRHHAPKTFWTVLIGALALAGFPPLAGFFSKDLVLADVLHTEPRGTILFWMGIVTAGLTAFYTARWLMLIFFGKPRFTHHAHESPAVMTVPLMVLAGLSVIAGFGEHGFASYLARSLGEHEPEVGSGVMMLASGIGVAGLVAGILTYRERVPGPGPATGLARISERKFWVDEIYDLIIVRTYRWASGVVDRWIDGGLIDKLAVEGSAVVTQAAGKVLRPVHSGQLHTYAFGIMLGLVVALGYFIWR